jgi:hypothetical protein
LGVFSGGEDDEEGQVVRDFIEIMFLAGGNVKDRARHHVLRFVFKLEFCSTGDDVVDFVFGVGLLVIGASGVEAINAQTERGNIEEFEVAMIFPVVAGEELFELVGVHSISSYGEGWRILFQ